MSEERKGKGQLERISELPGVLDGQDALYCIPDAEGHCVTCSDEALPATVVSVDVEAGLAIVQIDGTTEEVDITLVEDVAPGDVLLVHGGVAIVSAS
jgi:hypothetical protein